MRMIKFSVGIKYWIAVVLVGLLVGCGDNTTNLNSSNSSKQPNTSPKQQATLVLRDFYRSDSIEEKARLLTNESAAAVGLGGYIQASMLSGLSDNETIQNQLDQIMKRYKLPENPQQAKNGDYSSIKNSGRKFLTDVAGLISTAKTEIDRQQESLKNFGDLTVESNFNPTESELKFHTQNINRVVVESNSDTLSVIKELGRWRVHLGSFDQILSSNKASKSSDQQTDSQTEESSEKQTTKQADVPENAPAGWTPAKSKLDRWDAPFEWTTELTKSMIPESSVRGQVTGLDLRPSKITKRTGAIVSKWNFKDGQEGQKAREWTFQMADPSGSSQAFNQPKFHDPFLLLSWINQTPEAGMTLKTGKNGLQTSCAHSFFSLQNNSFSDRYFNQYTQASCSWIIEINEWNVSIPNRIKKLADQREVSLTFKEQVGTASGRVIGVIEGKDDFFGQTIRSSWVAGRFTEFPVIYIEGGYSMDG